MALVVLLAEPEDCCSGVRDVLLCLLDLRECGEAGRHVGVIGTVHPAVNVDRALERGLSASEITALFAKPTQLVQPRAQLWMLDSEEVLSVLDNLLQKQQRLVESSGSAQGYGEAGAAVEGVRVRPSHNGSSVVDHLTEMP